MKNKGFTLIELMIVIAILAIILAYAIPSYQDYMVRSKAGEGMVLSGNIKTIVSEAWASGIDITTIDNNTHGVGDATDYVGDWVGQVNVTAGVIQVVYSAADARLDGKSLVLTPVLASAGSIQWDCTSPDLLQYNPCR